MAGWSSIGSLYYPVYGTHDILVKPSGTDIKFRAAFPLVLDGVNLIPGDVAVHCNVPFTFPSSTYPKIEPLWSIYSNPPNPLTNTGPGEAMWPVTAKFAKPVGVGAVSSEVFGWWQVAKTAIPATFIRPQPCKTWSWFEYTNFHYSTAYFNEVGLDWNYYEKMTPGYYAKWFHQNISIQSQANLTLDSPYGNDSYFVALKDPSLGSLAPDGTTVVPPINYGDYFVVGIRSFPLNLAGKAWSPGTSPETLGLPQFGTWGGNIVTSGRTMPWSSCSGQVRGPVKVRLTNGVGSYSGYAKDGTKDFTVSDVTLQYEAKNAATKSFPYPLVDMSTGNVLTQLDNSLLYKTCVVRVNSHPPLPPPLGLKARGVEKLNGVYPQKNWIAHYPYRAAVARIDLEGYFL